MQNRKKELTTKTGIHIYIYIPGRNQSSQKLENLPLLVDLTVIIYVPLRLTLS